MDDAKSRIREIDIGEYQRMLAGRQPHMLIDIREESEWNAGHAAGSLHLGKGIIERDIETKVPRKDATLVLVLRGRIPVGPGRRRVASNGLFECHLARRRLAGVSGFWAARGEVVRARSYAVTTIFTAR